MEDYYKLLGVQSDDERETIREAYRTRKADLDAAGTDAARTEASRLNRAWNVLSDEGQRGRYDDQLAEAKADGTVEELPEYEPEAAAPVGRNGRARADRPVRQPIVQQTEVNGMSLASNKDRGFAFAIDALIVFLLTNVAPIFVGPQLVSESMRTPYCVTEYSDMNAFECQNELNEDAANKKDDVEDAESDIRKAEKDDASKTAIAKLEEGRDKLETEYDELVDEYEAVSKEVQPLQLSLFGGGYFIAFLLLFVPSALTGQTLGKKLRRVRLVGENGERAGLVPSLVRYGLVIGTTAIGFLFLGQLGQMVPLVWVFGITSFARNPKRQGWHDRIAKTYVAAD